MNGTTGYEYAAAAAAAYQLEAFESLAHSLNGQQQQQLHHQHRQQQQLQQQLQQQPQPQQQQQQQQHILHHNHQQQQQQQQQNRLLGNGKHHQRQHSGHSLHHQHHQPTFGGSNIYGSSALYHPTSTATSPIHINNSNLNLPESQSYDPSRHSSTGVASTASSQHRLLMAATYGQQPPPLNDYTASFADTAASVVAAAAAAASLGPSPHASINSTNSNNNNNLAALFGIAAAAAAGQQGGGGSSMALAELQAIIQLQQDHHHQLQQQATQNAFQGLTATTPPPPPPGTDYLHLDGGGGGGGGSNMASSSSPMRLMANGQHNHHQQQQQQQNLSCNSSSCSNNNVQQQLLGVDSTDFDELLLFHHHLPGFLAPVQHQQQQETASASSHAEGTITTPKRTYHDGRNINNNTNNNGTINLLSQQHQQQQKNSPMLLSSIWDALSAGGGGGDVSNNTKVISNDMDKNNLVNNISFLTGQQQGQQDQQEWLKEIIVKVPSISLEPLSGSDIHERIVTNFNHVVTRYIPCVDFLVQCQQDLRKGLEHATARQQRASSNKRRSDAQNLNPAEFFSLYVDNLPRTFYKNNFRKMDQSALEDAYQGLQKLRSDAKKSEVQGCEAVKSNFLGGMKDGESWGLRKWLSKHGNALTVCTDLECIMNALQKLDRSLESTAKLASLIRPMAKVVLDRLRNDIPPSYQQRSTAHPYLPFFHRLEAALQGMSTFDPDDDDVVCIDDDSDDDVVVEQVQSSFSSKTKVLTETTITTAATPIQLDEAKKHEGGSMERKKGITNVVIGDDVEDEDEDDEDEDDDAYKSKNNNNNQKNSLQAMSAADKEGSSSSSGESDSESVVEIIDTTTMAHRNTNHGPNDDESTYSDFDVDHSLGCYLFCSECSSVNPGTEILCSNCGERLPPSQLPPSQFQTKMYEYDIGDDNQQKKHGSRGNGTTSNNNVAIRKRKKSTPARKTQKTRKHYSSSSNDTESSSSGDEEDEEDEDDEEEEEEAAQVSRARGPKTNGIVKKRQKKLPLKAPTTTTKQSVIVWPTLPLSDRATLINSALAMAHNLDQLATLFDSSKNPLIRPAHVNIGKFWNGRRFADALRLFVDLLRNPESPHFVENVDDDGLIQNGNPPFSHVVKHPICFRDIVSALILDVETTKDDKRNPKLRPTVLQSSRHGGTLPDRSLAKWNMWNGLELLQAIDLVLLNSLAYEKALSKQQPNGARKGHRSSVNQIRKGFWDGITNIIATNTNTEKEKKTYLPTRRSESSGFVVYKINES